VSIKFWIVVTALVLATVATVDATVDAIIGYYYVYKIDVEGIIGIVGVAGYMTVEVVIGVDKVWFTTLYMIYYIEKNIIYHLILS